MERDIVAIRRFVHRLRLPTSLLGLPRFAIARIIEMRPGSSSGFDGLAGARDTGGHRSG